MLHILKIPKHFRLCSPKTEKLINWWWNTGTPYYDLELNSLFLTRISLTRICWNILKKTHLFHKKKPLQKDFPGFRCLMLPAMLLKVAVEKCFWHWLNLVAVNLLHVCQNHYVNKAWTCVPMATSSICLDTTLAADAATNPGDCREHSGVGERCPRAHGKAGKGRYWHM